MFETLCKFFQVFEFPILGYNPNQNTNHHHLHQLPLLTLPSNVVVTLNFHYDQIAFAELAREHILKHATKSRADWRTVIVGGSLG